jgi:hypothetical protein
VRAAGEEFPGPARQIELHLRRRPKRLPLPWRSRVAVRKSREPERRGAGALPQSELRRMSAGGLVSAEEERRRAGDGLVRNIRRDAHTDVRERAATRMATPESKAQYARRSPIAWLKGVLGLRQFRHVGLEKVETEWRWACLTMNLKKILSVLSRLRRQTRCPQPSRRPPKSDPQCDSREFAGLIVSRRFDHHVQRPSSATRPFDTAQPPVPESRRSKYSSHRRGDPYRGVILQRAPCGRVKQRTEFQTARLQTCSRAVLHLPSDS